MAKIRVQATGQPFQLPCKGKVLHFGAYTQHIVDDSMVDREGLKLLEEAGMVNVRVEPEQKDKREEAKDVSKK
jgi:pyruvate formate-lyase activating enzyme-like uncharacterized protein